MSMQGKMALVTGAGGGVGRCLVEQLRAEEARVVAVDLDAGALEAFADDAGVTTVVANVAVAADVERALAAAEGGVDILFNNAAILDRLGLVDEVTEAEWRRLLDVNLTGPFLFCHLAVPGMLERGGGAIVNTASVGGLRGARAGAAYTASKFGVVGLTLNIAATLGARGIRCNAVCPGSIATDMGAGLQLTANAQRLVHADTHRPAPIAPDRIAAAALFLARDESVHINGAVLPVDDGWIAY